MCTDKTKQLTIVVIFAKAVGSDSGCLRYTRDIRSNVIAKLQIFLIWKENTILHLLLTNFCNSVSKQHANNTNITEPQTIVVMAAKGNGTESI